MRNHSSKLEKEHHSRTASSKNETIKEEEEKKPASEHTQENADPVLDSTRTEANGGVATTVIHFNLEENKIEQDLVENDFKNWIERNNMFFNGKFFPAADKFLVITQLVNRSL